MCPEGPREPHCAHLCEQEVTGRAHVPKQQEFSLLWNIHSSCRTESKIEKLYLKSERSLVMGGFVLVLTMAGISIGNGDEKGLMESSGKM